VLRLAGVFHLGARQFGHGGQPPRGCYRTTLLTGK
jgi:hypothetical protein